MTQNKIYQPQPEPGSIRQVVETKRQQARSNHSNPGANPDQLNEEKFASREAWKEQRRLIADILGNKGTLPEFTVGEFRVVPTAPVQRDPLTDFVEIRATIFRADGTEIPHPDGRWQFQAPNFEVHDGTWRKEIREMPEGVDDVEIDVPNMREDVEAGFKAHLIEAVVLYISGLEGDG